MPNYSIWAMEFASLATMPNWVLVYGATEGTREIPFHYDVIVGEGRVILVDSGFSDNAYCTAQMEQWGVTGFKTPADILPKIGIQPEDVDTILMSHHHWDHISGVNYFPNATVYLQRRDAEKWMSLITEPTKTSFLRGGLDPQTGSDLVRIGGEGRLRLVEGTFDVAPGIQLRPAYDTHTPGSQFAVVEANDGAGSWVFAGDTGYVYDNFGGQDGSGPVVPIGNMGGSTFCCVMSIQEMLEAAGDIGRVVPGHDSTIWDRFPSIVSDDGLHLAELQLAEGVSSKIGR